MFPFWIEFNPAELIQLTGIVTVIVTWLVLGLTNPQSV